MLAKIGDAHSDGEEIDSEHIPFFYLYVPFFSLAPISFIISNIRCGYLEADI
jgi:hypothetical protein